MRFRAGPCPWRRGGRARASPEVEGGHARPRRYGCDEVGSMISRRGRHWSAGAAARNAVRPPPLLLCSSGESSLARLLPGASCGALESSL